MAELKPCPFCGEQARLYVAEGGVCVMCTGSFSKGCGCRTDWYSDTNYSDGTEGWRKTKHTAIERAVIAWNRRADNG